MAQPESITLRNIQKTRISQTSELFAQAEKMGFGDLHFKFDPQSQLTAIIAIHNTRLGPALGGSRFTSYPSQDAAVLDAMRLAKGMSYKAALAGLPLGGGKAVIIRPEHVNDRERLFRAYGEFVNQLGGRYITSVDVGTSVSDMDIIAEKTSFVRGTSQHQGGAGDPSPSIARGVRYGIQAAVEHKLGKSSLDNVHVVIQGVGHVGYYLARELSQFNARLTVCDINTSAAKRCAQEFGARVVALEKIYDVTADVFAPCAMGGAINAQTLDRLKTPIVAGAANNQLVDADIGAGIHRRGILYAPDYVINAGGLIHIALVEDAEAREQKLAGIHDTLLHLFQQSEVNNQPTHSLTDQMAEKILYPTAVH